tara:strand:+ start:2030 stop:2167 length:138 start_codon:yes stop_codon:yes gene_type:complete
MKKIFFIFIALWSCSSIEFPWNKITFDEAIINHDKPIMVYFYATW